MSRTLSLCALLAVTPALCRADDKPSETLVILKVNPMAAPKPALKYQLLPELKEMNPGNPIQGYLKCFMEQQNFFFNQVSVQNRERWESMPLKELPLTELRAYGGSALRQADYAARLDNPDWQVLLKAKSDGIWLLMPEVQQMRMLAIALKVRFRGEIAEGHFNDAIATAKTMIALARHLETHPTLIADLVGIAIAGVAIEPVEEMIQQPGCPNLYWALTNLPSPFIDIRRGLQGERLMVEAEFPGLIDTAPMSNAQLEQILGKWGEGMKHVVQAKKKDIMEWVEVRAKDERFVLAARQRLVEAGLPQERVKTFRSLQVVLLDDKREYELRLDEAIKWMGLPYWQAEAGFLRNRSARDANNTVFGKMLNTLFGESLESLLKVRRAQTRVDRRLAMLRHVEAIRLYAADHGGKLPAKLSDLPVPVPDDPFTGKPFSYQVEGQTAHLRAGPPISARADPAYDLHFEMTIKN